jgi:hypothetical protein
MLMNLGLFQLTTSVFTNFFSVMFHFGEMWDSWRDKFWWFVYVCVCLVGLVFHIGSWNCSTLYHSMCVTCETFCPTEHVVSIIASMLRNCRGPQRQRLLSKFTENDHEKVDRLLELHFKYLEKVEEVDLEIDRDRRVSYAFIRIWISNIYLHCSLAYILYRLLNLRYLFWYFVLFLFYISRYDLFFRVRETFQIIKHRSFHIGYIFQSL